MNAAIIFPSDRISCNTGLSVVPLPPHKWEKPNLPIWIRKKTWGFCYIWCGRAWETMNLPRP